MDTLTWSEFLLTLSQGFNVTFVPNARGPVGDPIPVLRRTLPDGSTEEMVFYPPRLEDANRVAPFTRIRSILDRLRISQEEFDRV